MKKSSIIIIGLILALLPLVPIQFAKGMRSVYGIVELMSPSFRGGGTGFHLMTPDGSRYIMTNSHVCDAAINGVMISIFKDQLKEVKVLKQDATKDLCLLEPMLDVIGVEKFTKDVELLPVITSGYGGLSSITTNIGFKKSPHIIPICTQQGMLGMCMSAELFRSDEYDFIVIGGHSGSPILSPFGALVGVIFAGNGKTSFAVPISTIMEFLDDASNSNL